MKKILITGILLNICALAAFAQSAGKISLLVKNCEETESICNTQHVFRYDFTNGVFTGKEKIITTDSNDVRFDLGANRVYRNRFLITDGGDVIDINAGKVLHRGEGELVGIEGDDVVIKVNRVDKEGIFKYNLPDGKYSRVNSPNIYEAEGSVSPDKRYVAFGKALGGISLKEIKTGKKKDLKGNFSVNLSVEASEIGKLPVFWLDNQRILTQKSNGDIQIVHLDGRIEPVVKIKIKENPYTSPEFYRNRDGDIIYNCYGSYVIDIRNKTFKRYETVSHGNGFYSKSDLSVSNNWGTKDIYFYKDTEIGRIWSSNVASTSDFLALIYGQDLTNLGYPDGVKVWNNIKKDWTTLEIKWSPQIIGWVTN